VKATFPGLFREIEAIEENLKKHFIRTDQSFDITIAGEINLDLILDGLREPMPVERELVASAFKVTLGSSSAILAHNLAILGRTVGFVTLAAKDEFAKIALAYLAESGVDLSKIRYSDGPAGSGVTVLLNHGSQRHILSYLGTTCEMSVKDLDFEYLCSSRHFHLSSLFLLKALHKDLPMLFKKIKQRGLTISLDTNDDPNETWGGVLDEILPMVDILLPNESELLRMTRAQTINDALSLMSQKVPLIVVKCGSNGSIVQQGDRRQVIPPIQIAPIDTIGAGDSFNAGFLSSYLRGRSPSECAAMGNIVGAISTLRSEG
jgi:sugar/nucleoside kinase (ribokinase family)